MMRTDDKALLSSISEQPGGKTLHEIHDELGMDNSSVEMSVFALRSKGYEITVLYLSDRTIRRVYLSPYNSKEVI